MRPVTRTALVTTFSVAAICISALGASRLRGEEVTAQQAELLTANRHMLLLEYYIYSDAIVGDGDLPRLQIYSDGSILVNFPPFMKAGGYYTSEAGAEEISEISSQLINHTALLTSSFADFGQLQSSEITMQTSAQVLHNFSHQMLYQLVLHPPLFALDPASKRAISSPVQIRWVELQSSVGSGTATDALETLVDITELLDKFISRASTDAEPAARP